VLGDFALFLSLPSLRHMAQVPIAPLAADIQAVLQDPPAQPDALPDAPAVQPVTLQADGLNLCLATNLRLYNPLLKFPLKEWPHQPVFQNW